MSDYVLVALRQLYHWQWIGWWSYLELKFSKSFQVVCQQRLMPGLYTTFY